MKKYLFFLVVLASIPIMGDNIDELENKISESVDKIEEIRQSIVEDESKQELVDYIDLHKKNGINADFSSFDGIDVDSEFMKSLTTELNNIKEYKILINFIVIEDVLVDIYGSIGVNDQFRDKLKSNGNISTKLIEDLYLAYHEGSGEYDKFIISDYLIYLGKDPYETAEDIDNGLFEVDQLWDLSFPDSSELLGQISNINLNIDFNNLEKSKEIITFVNKTDYWDLITVMLVNESLSNNIKVYWDFLEKESDRELLELSLNNSLSYNELVTFRDKIRLLISKLESNKFVFTQEVLK